MTFSGSLFSPADAYDRGSQEQFLRFCLLPETMMMLPVSQLTEVLTIPSGQIIPIPHMPPWVMGVYNWRGEILWMVDLGHLLGFTPWHQQAFNKGNYRAIVLHPSNQTTKARNQMLGLVVSRVEDMEWCNPEDIKSPPSSAVTSSLVPFLRGYWLKENGDMVITLQGDAIFAAMPKA